MILDGDPDLDWLRAQVKLLDETIRQTIDAKRRLEGKTLAQCEATNAVRTLRHMVNRTRRIIERLEAADR